MRVLGPRQSQRFQIVFRFLLPPALYGLAAVLITWPAVSQLTTYGLGAGYGDEFENVRLIWWTHYALQHGLNPFFQSLLGYPNGFFSAAQWAEPLSYWPATLLAFAVGPLVAFNLWMLLQFVLNGWAAFAVCREVMNATPSLPPPETDKPIRETAVVASNRRATTAGLYTYLAALIGGFIFTAYPTIQGQISGGHINVPVLFGLVLFTLCLWRIVRGRARRWTVIGGGVAFALTALVHTDQAIYTLFPVTLFFLGYHALFRRTQFWRREIIVKVVALFVIAILLLLPFFLPLLVDLAAPTKTADLQETGWIAFSTDPLGFFSPSPFTTWGAKWSPAYTRTVLGTNTIEGTAYIGVITLALCAIALARGTRSLRPWLVMALGSALFSLGPFLKWGDQPVVYTLGSYKSYVTLPWAFFQTLPLLDASRTPGRFNLATGLALAVIAASGAQALLIFLSRSKRFNRSGLRVALVGALLISIGVDYQLFFPALTTPAAIPSYFYGLAKRTDVRAVFDIPWDDPLAAKDALYWQTAHQKPLIAGYVLRQTPVDPAQLAVLQAAATGTGFASESRLADRGSELALLNNAGADVVVAHLRYLHDTSGLEAQLGAPIYRDNDTEVFIVPKANQPSGLLGTLSPDGQTLCVYAPADGDLIIGTKDADDTDTLKPELLSVDGQPAGLLNRRVRLTHGYHSLQIVGGDSGALTLRSAFVPEGTAPKIRLGSSLTLESTAISQTSAALTVTTAWHADQPLRADYHFFIHAVNAAGIIVAQYDNQPGAGTYPTTQWAANQDWTESDDLPLNKLGPGTYHIQAGWYSYPAMQRLPVYGNTPGAPDGLIELGVVTIGAIERF